MDCNESISLKPMQICSMNREDLNDLLQFSCEKSEMNATDHIQVLTSKERSKIYSIFEEVSVSKHENGRLSAIDRYMQQLAFQATRIFSGYSYNSQTNHSHSDISYHSSDDVHVRKLHERTAAIYRLRMSDWCYKVCDFIEANRQIVAIAFNYLDRFLAIERYSCDSSFDYKVASVTCLLIALKVHNRKAIQPSTLANLSRNGEITVQHILTMECMILDALGYQLCPPTSHSFVSLFYAFLPSRVKDASGQEFLQCALYLADLSVMDSPLCSIDQSLVAFAMVLCTLETLDGGNYLSDHEKETFIKKIETSLGRSSSDGLQEMTTRIKDMLMNLCLRCSHHKGDSSFSPKGGKLSRHKSADAVTSFQLESRDDMSIDPSPRDVSCCRSID